MVLLFWRLTQVYRSACRPFLAAPECVWAVSFKLPSSWSGSMEDSTLTRSTVNLEVDKFAGYLDRIDLDIL